MEGFQLKDMEQLLSEIQKDLASETRPLSLRKKFTLFMIPDKILSTTLQDKKRKELQLVADAFDKTSLKGYRIDRYKSIKTIFTTIKSLYDLDFYPDKEEKDSKLNTLATMIRKLHKNDSVIALDNIKKTLTEISELRHPQYEDYCKLCKIIDLENSLSQNISIHIKLELEPEAYLAICEHPEK